MRVIFVRHGTRERRHGVADVDQGLTEQGRDEARQLAALLQAIRVTPTHYFSSRYSHAKQTALLLQELLSPTPGGVRELACLTPHDPTQGIIDFASQADIPELDPGSNIAVVGHEPRLGRMLASLTSAPASPLGRAEAVCVTVPAWQDLATGGGKVEWRWSPPGSRKADLAPKVASKMSVSGVLAGLTLTAVTVLLGGANPSPWRTIAVLLLTAGAALFVASLYAYDQLQMPEAYWSEKEQNDSEKPSRLGREPFREDARQHGVLYAEMVWHWKFLFNPAVALATSGYLAMLGDLRSGLPSGTCGAYSRACDYLPLALGLLTVMTVLAYYARVRPRLAVD
jgi:phosphohistidine phosphatase SixA